MLFLLEKRNKVKSPKESITKVICTKKSQISLCFNFLEICKQCRGKLEANALFIKFIQEDFRIGLFMKPCLLVLVPVNTRQEEKNNLQLQSLTAKKRDLSSL